MIDSFIISIGDSDYDIETFDHENDYGDVGLGFKTHIDGIQHVFKAWVNPGLVDVLTLPQGQAAYYDLLSTIEAEVTAELQKVLDA